MDTQASIFRDALDAAIVEIEAENWNSARKKIVVAQIQFMKLPTMQRKGLEMVQYRERLDSMIEMLQTIDSLAASSKRTGDNQRLITTKMGF